MASLTGRHTHPAVRLGFKLSRGRQTLPGRFDSCCLPPRSGWGLEAGAADRKRLREQRRRLYLPPPAVTGVAMLEE
jgi:hypothetical protein